MNIDQRVVAWGDYSCSLSNMHYNMYLELNGKGHGYKWTVTYTRTGWNYDQLERTWKYTYYKQVVILVPRDINPLIRDVSPKGHPPSSPFN